MGFDEESMGVSAVRRLIMKVNTSINGPMGRGSRSHGHNGQYSGQETAAADGKHVEATYEGRMKMRR